MLIIVVTSRLSATSATPTTAQSSAPVRRYLQKTNTRAYLSPVHQQRCAGLAKEPRVSRVLAIVYAIVTFIIMIIIIITVIIIIIIIILLHLIFFINYFLKY